MYLSVWMRKNIVRLWDGKEHQSRYEVLLILATKQVHRQKTKNLLSSEKARRNSAIKRSQFKTLKKLQHFSPMSDPQAWTCHTCGNVGLADGFDGFYYCLRCGSQADDIIETGVADEDFADKGGTAGAPLYIASHRRSRPSGGAAIMAEPISQVPPATIQSHFWTTLNLDDDVGGGYRSNQAKTKTEEIEFDGVGPSGPEDFGSVGKSVPSFEEYYNEIRIRYVMGLQLMIEFQCEALVREFKVSPLICGLAGTIWLRFVAGTRVFDDDWVDDSINESESQHQGLFHIL